MNGKILIFIRDYQIKRNIISILTHLQVQFMECFEEEELSFKLQLYTEGNRVFIYEFTGDVTDEEYTRLKSIKEKGWKILAIYPKYAIRYIDESQKIKIDDLMTHPVALDSLKRKIISLMNKMTPEAKENTVFPENLHDAVRIEINRATRGNYPLSFVMISPTEMTEEQKDIFSGMLKEHLRETDMIYTEDDAHTYMVLCPFTPKNSLVEVENKIRHVFEEIREPFKIARKDKIYVHGLTLDEDGQTYQEIYEKLLKGIHDSKLLDQEDIQDLFKDRSKLMAYRNLFKRI